MVLNYAAKVDIGRKETNDDRALVSQRIVNMDTQSGVMEIPGLVAVCDGCGGYAGGDLAATAVLETLNQENAKDLLDENYLSAVLQKCSNQVFLKKKEMPQFSGMCTTVAGCVFGTDKTVIFHAGDSRVYRFDGNYLAQMTIDHSVVQNMVETGRMTEDEAVADPGRNVITRCIGMECPPPDIYVSNCPVAPGELYLLCSDGFWECVKKKRITEILSKDVPPEEKVRELVENALENGSDDNITVCICAGDGRPVVKENEPFLLD